MRAIIISCLWRLILYIYRWTSLSWCLIDRSFVCLDVIKIVSMLWTNTIHHRYVFTNCFFFVYLHVWNLLLVQGWCSLWGYHQPILYSSNFELSSRWVNLLWSISLFLSDLASWCVQVIIVVLVWRIVIMFYVMMMGNVINHGCHPWLVCFLWFSVF